VRRFGPVLALVVLLSAACSEGIERTAETIASLTPSASASPTAPTAGPSSTSPTASPGAEAPIVVEFPAADAQAFSPCRVSGTAEVSGGVVAVRVLDARGQELAAMSVDVSCGAGCRGTFSADLAFFVQTEQEGTVEVYEPRPNGTQANLVRVPVLLVAGV
jgi:hypothetical protein